MISASETMPKSVKPDQLIVEKLGTELMIYDKARNKAFCLNQSAAFVWQHCDGVSSVKDVTAEMVQTLGKPVDEDVVTFALSNLAKDGLLQETSTMPLFNAAMSRRDLIQKIGVRAAVALPLVTALAVATPRAHASYGSGGGKPGRPRH